MIIQPALVLTLLLACTDGASSVDVQLSDGGASDGGASDGGGSDGQAGGDDPPPCPVDAEHEQTGNLQDPAISEASGLVASATEPDLLWVHNDSGNDPALYAIDSTGQTSATIAIEGVDSGDWEDLALGPGPDDGAPWLYVGDIGDNGRSDGTARILLLPEPPFQDATVPAETLELDYPDGPHDAEALVVDPETRELVIITKEKDGISLVFSADLADDPPVLEQVASVDLNGAAEGMLALVTAADLTQSGSCVLVRTYTHLLGFARPAGEPLASAFDSEPVVLETVPELQGETVAAFPGGYWTISEGEGAAINLFSLPPPPE